LKRIVLCLLCVSFVLALALAAFGAPRTVAKVNEFALPSLSGQPYRPRISGDWVVAVRNYAKRAENVVLINVPARKLYTIFDIADGTSIIASIDGDLVVWPGKSDQVPGLRGTRGKRGQWARSMILYEISTGSYYAPELSTNSAFSVSISGGLVAYELGSRIYLHDVARGVQRRISDNNPYHSGPEISGDFVVWAGKTDDSDKRQVYAYQISGGRQLQLTSDPVDHRSPMTDGRYIVWWTDAGVDVYDTTNTSTFAIPKAFFPAVDDGIVVYQRPESSGPGCTCNSPMPVYGMDIATRREFRISSGTANVGPDIDAGRVIWCTGDTIYCSELSTKTTR